MDIYIYTYTYFVITQQITSTDECSTKQSSYKETNDHFCWVGFVKFDDQLQKQKKKEKKNCIQKTSNGVIREIELTKAMIVWYMQRYLLRVKHIYSDYSQFVVNQMKKFPLNFLLATVKIE